MPNVESSATPIDPAFKPGSLGLTPSASAVETEVAALGAAACCHDEAQPVRGWRAYLELAKPRITRLVTMTALGGLGLSVVGRGIDSATIGRLALVTALATAAASAGANALNQCMEVARDARMLRTRGRPLPMGRVSMAGALTFGIAACIGGVACLYTLIGPAPALVAFATIVTYLALYTPLKPRTLLNTWVGAIPGALPPLIGWSAAAPADLPLAAHFGISALGGWSLFALMFVWQIPHFLAIAWMHREDYARGGYRMLPLTDPTGDRTVRHIFLWSALLVVASALPSFVMPERISPVYAAVALIAGASFFTLALPLRRDRSTRGARRVFIASIIHLPVLLLALVVDATIKALV
ncbi:MAG: heme o synthase [Phycisphaerales bacterium]